MEKPAFRHIPYAFKVFLHLKKRAFMAVSAALPGIVNQHLPVQALIFGIIISQKIIEGIASAQNCLLYTSMLQQTCGGR